MSLKPLEEFSTTEYITEKTSKLKVRKHFHLIMLTIQKANLRYTFIDCAIICGILYYDFLLHDCSIICGIVLY